MFRRSRFNVKPNVRPSAAGRGNSGSGNSSEAPAAAPEAQHAPETTASSADASSDSQPGPVGDPQQGCSGGGSSSRDEKTGNSSGDGNSIKCTDSPFQRRKRISTIPNLAKPRVSSTSACCAVSSVSKYSQKWVPRSPPGNSVLQKESPSCEKTNIEKSPILPEKKTPLPQVPQFSPFKKSGNKETNLAVTAHKSDEAQQNNISSPLKERPTQESLMQEEIQQAKPAAAKEKKICSDHEKIIKAKKLRQLLKEELKKEKQQRKSKYPIIEKHLPEDRSKMIMRDFIYYLPENNPMKSSLVEEKKLERTAAQTKEPEDKIVADHEDENEEVEEEEGEEDDGPLLVPRVKVAEDGSIILDEESLTIEVLRTKGQCVVEENDPIFERGSTTTYSSFRKNYYTKPWSEKETEMFFLAISMVGTDFSMISQLFPHRARTEIKNKFKREEKANGWRIDKAFKEKRPFDFDLFAKLLEKVLENERRKANDGKCQLQKEKTVSERKLPKSQKKRKAKVINGQPSLGQDDQNANISDAEMEVDCGTAEKENEESFSILEQTEGQTVNESVMKKKRKKKKKDSEQEAENLSEGKTIPSESVEGERLRKERESVSSSTKNHCIDETGGELEVSDGQTLEDTHFSAEDNPQCSKQLNEETGGEDSLISSSIQDGTFVEDKSELQVLQANSKDLVEQFSKSSISSSANEEEFEETHAEMNELAELDKLDKRTFVLSSSNEKTEITETDKTATEKVPIKQQLQGFEPNLSRTSEKNELPVANTLESQPSSSKPVGGIGKTIMEDKAAKIIGSITDEFTERSNSDMGRESQGAQKAPEEKGETRGRRQRPKPNIIKASCRKEAPLQGKLEHRVLCPEPNGSVRKNNDQDDSIDAIPGETTEKNYQVLDAESLTCEKSALQENGKQTILRPALLARGRMKKPRPNLGTVAKRQAETPRISEAAEEKTTEATVETKKTLTQYGCSGSDLLTKQASEATNNEAGAPDSEELENKAVATPDKMGLIHSIQPSVKKPSCAKFELKETSQLSGSVEDVLELVSGDSSLQEIQKETAAEIQHCLENFTQTLKKNLGEAAERKEPLGPEKEMLEDNHLTQSAEKKTIHLSSECGKLSDLDEGATCGILPSLCLSEGHTTDAQEAVAMQTTLPPPPNSSVVDSGDPSEVSVCRDSQENSSVGRQSSKEGKQSAIQPMPLLRGRLQRPKPNIGRAVGRKEIQSAEKNVATAMITGTEKPRVQKSEPTRTSSIALMLDNKILPAEASEDSLLDCEKMAQEDFQVPSTSQKISDCCAMEKTLPQEDKPCTIKPAQLMRGRFQRPRPNLGKLNGKKKYPMSENVTLTVEEEKEKTETETLMKSAHHRLSKDEADVCVSLSGLEERVQSEASEAILPERCSDQKEVSSPETSQSCEFLKDQVEISVSKDVGEKQLDTLASAVSGSQEQSSSKSIMPTLLMKGHLQRPKPNLSRRARKKEVSSEGERSTENKAGKDTEDKSGKISSVIHDSGKQVGITSLSESRRQEKCVDDIKLEDSKRSKPSETCQSSEQSLGRESQIREKISNSLSVQERASETLKRKQPDRTLKQRKPVRDSRPTYSTSECETDHNEKGRRLQKVKPNVSRDRRLKPAFGKKPRKEYGSSKVNLVTLRASSQEDDDDNDVDDFEPYYEVECFLPEEVNKAPVFVPKGLRSPNPVPVQIEETMEEIEVYENIPEEVYVSTPECLFHEQNIGAESVIQRNTDLHSSQLVIIQERSEEQKGVNDGSTEAAMTLLAMRDPAFQLNISTQESLRKFPDQDEEIVADNFLNEHNEEQCVLDSNTLLSAPSKHELIFFNNASRTSPGDHIHSTGQSDFEGGSTAATVIVSSPSDKEAVSSHNMNKATLMDHNAFGLEEHFQEASRVCSDGSSSQGNKVCKPARCRFPKPKPNLGRGRGVNRSASSKSLDVGVEQSNQTQNEENIPQSFAENQKVELDQNLGMDASCKISSADKHDFQLERSSCAAQKNGIERENLAIEASQDTSMFSDPQPSPRTETWPSGLPNDSNSKINVEFHEKSPDHVEHHFSIEAAQNEERKHSDSSAIMEMTTVGAGVKECSAEEEEQTIILTLVEISADSQDCSGASASLQQASEELLPAPVFFTSDSMELVELTREDSSGSIKAAAEENTVSMANITEIGQLQTTSAEKSADCGSTALKDRKRHALDLERSGSPPEKKKLSAGESLKCSNKEALLKSSSITKKPAGKNSEKLSILKKQNSTTFRSVPEPTESHAVEEKEKPQASLLPGVPPDTDEQVSRTLCSGKGETSEEQRRFADIYKPVRSGQTESTVVLPKISSSRPYQRSLGFLPLICKTSTEEVTTQGNKQSLKKSCTDVSKSTLEPTLFSKNNKKDIQGNRSFPSTVSKCENVSSSTIQVCSQLYENENSSKDQEKDEEPTRISEYFFRDIFMEVDDSE
ncbi:transcription factor TFIIIB component B'' homolog [Heteronotia binoei]|uniref:transcription factor TFIIIB component B'' homolog n=1 Tax=Heteronotia binoei TaxID=13085 RepID=UPI00292E7B65|nr:transcription factor TFIIIB component B'' homolog [Heteronotia binoei]